MWRISCTRTSGPLGAEQAQLLSRLPRLRRRRVVVHDLLKREPRLALVAHLEEREPDLEKRGRRAVALREVLPDLVELKNCLRVVTERVVALADPIVRVA